MKKTRCGGFFYFRGQSPRPQARKAGRIVYQYQKCLNNNQKVKAGDSYPVWSFDEITGKWVFEANGTVRDKTPASASNFEVVFQSTHLSYWNLDYFESENCTGSINIARNPTGDSRPLNIDVIGVEGSRFYRSSYGITDSTVTLVNSPRINVNVMVRDSNGNLVGTALNQDLCAGVNISTDPLPSIQYGTLQVNVTESCTDGFTGRRSVPTDVYFYNTSNGQYQGGYTPTGYSIINDIQANTMGTVNVWNRVTSSWDMRNITFIAPTTTLDVNFPDLQCISGSE